MVTKPKKLNCDKNQKLKLWRNSKTQIVTNLSSDICDSKNSSDSSDSSVSCDSSDSSDKKNMSKFFFVNSSSDSSNSDIF